jgi:hypothetical protein
VIVAGSDSAFGVPLSMAAIVNVATLPLALATGLYRILARSLTDIS